MATCEESKPLPDNCKLLKKIPKWFPLDKNGTRPGTWFERTSTVEVTYDSNKVIEVWSEPYCLTCKDIQEILAFAIINDLDVHMSGQSYYYPGATMLVSFNKKEK